MYFIKYILLSILFTVTLVANTNLNLTKQEKEYIKNNPIIKVHNERNWAPYNYNIDGEPLGYSIEYIKLLASKIDIKVEFISGYTWNQFMEKIKNNDIDVMLNIAKTEKRKKFLAYTSMYHKGIDAVFTRNDSTYNGLNDFNGKILAVVKGFYEEELLREFYPNIKLVTAKNSFEAMKLVSFGKADGCIDNLASGNYILSQYQLTHLKPSFEIADRKFNLELHIATNKNNTILRDILEKVKQQLSEEESQSITNLWLLNKSNFKYKKLEKSRLILSQLNSDYMKNKKQITMCIDPDWMPFEKFDKNGKHIGMTADYFKIFNNMLNIEMKVVKTKTWDETLEFVKNRKCDIVSLAMETPKRKKYLNFTTPYLKVPLVIATKLDVPFVNDIESISGEKVGITKGYAFAEILRNKYPNLEIVEVEDMKSGLDKVNEDKLFGYIGTLASIGYMFQTGYSGELKITGKFDEKWELGIGVRNDDKILLNILQKAVNYLEAKQQQQILNTWISVKYEKKIDYTLVWQILIVVFIIILGFVYRNRELSKLNIQLELFASTDPMTKLYNRRYFIEIAESILDLDKRNNENTSVVILDIDKFKDVNDTYGHKIGDDVIVALADILQDHGRKSDIVCRWGGEEFVILLPNTNTNGAFIISERIRKAIENMKINLDDNKRFNITASFGVSQVKYEIDNHIDCAISRADDALYEAKESGRNKVCINTI